MNVPYLDLDAHHEPIRVELMRAVESVLDSGAFAGGPHVAAFEREFARYCGVREAVGVASGTDALYFALVALGVGPGDEVISPPNTFVAIAEAVARCGARLIFVDIDGRSYQLDPQLLEAAITLRCKAIVPTHLFGHIGDMDTILEIARSRGIAVLEDASQAHGARRAGRRAGQFGVAAAFSFYPGKNLGALGEAGAIVTDDPDLAETARALRDHGQYSKYKHELLGWNGRMDGIQAAALRVKLPRLDEGNRRRRALARRYREALADCDGILLPREDPDSEPVYHIFAIRVENRDRIIAELKERGIGCSVHYPVCLHLQPVCQALGYRPGDFPVAERCAKTLLSLPIYPELSFEQVDYVSSQLVEALASREALVG